MADPSNAEMRKTVTEYLTNKNLPPKADWLEHVLQSIRPNTPIPASQQTALFRLLSADLTVSVQPSQSMLFPPSVSDPQTKEQRLRGPLTVQVLDAEDIGHSRWSQVEDLEAHERGETTRGRKIIRVVTDEPNETAPATNTNHHPPKSGSHKLLVQDAAGTQCYAFDTSPIPSLNLEQLSIGSKLVLQEVTVARGVALLEPKNVEVLGGKVEAWDKKWRAERKEILQRRANMGAAAE